MNYPSKVMLTEVGLRDGLQNECTSVSTDRKMELLTDILAAGFKAVEIGSFVRPDRVPQMADSGDYRLVEQADWRNAAWHYVYSLYRRRDAGDS